MCVPNTEVIPINDYVAFMLFCVPLKVEQVLVVIQLEKKNRSGSIWWGVAARISGSLPRFST